MLIRLSRPTERVDLLALWERSVRATHTFLTEDDIQFYRPLVIEFLASEPLELFVLADEADTPIGFLALAGHAIDALFLEPAHRGRGNGRRLVAHAQKLRGGTLTVDVNQQNVAACGFYGALGFNVVAVSALDGTGRPYPLLHQRREAPTGTEEDTCQP
jgi:putative acetyltransferase